MKAGCRFVLTKNSKAFATIAVPKVRVYPRYNILFLARLPSGTSPTDVEFFSRYDAQDILQVHDELLWI